MATPNTNLIFQETANGIRNVKTGQFYPFKGVDFRVSYNLDSKVNVRYYVKHIILSYSSVAGDAGTDLIVRSYINNEELYLAHLRKTTLTANTQSQYFPVGLLLDKEKTIYFSAADISSVSCMIYYAEVDDLA